MTPHQKVNGNDRFVALKIFSMAGSGFFLLSTSDQMQVSTRYFGMTVPLCLVIIRFIKVHSAKGIDQAFHFAALYELFQRQGDRRLFRLQATNLNCLIQKSIVKS